MYESCLQKQQKVKELFETCANEQDTYRKIIDLGREMPPIDATDKVDENRVRGCQSIMYLVSDFKDGKVFFEAESDALISSGLAALMVKAYSGETPEAILKCPPDFLEELGITASITPNRANGLFSLHLRMKQDALKYLLG
ncbi:MAG: SufE family protein [Chlamydiia bacterium]|nr:SufE family protein [Chlamydiia bacterium]